MDQSRSSRKRSRSVRDDTLSVSAVAGKPGILSSVGQTGGRLGSAASGTSNGVATGASSFNSSGGSLLGGSSTSSLASSTSSSSTPLAAGTQLSPLLHQQHSSHHPHHHTHGHTHPHSSVPDPLSVGFNLHSLSAFSPAGLTGDASVSSAVDAALADISGSGNKPTNAPNQNPNDHRLHPAPNFTNHANAATSSLAHQSHFHKQQQQLQHPSPLLHQSQHLPPPMTHNASLHPSSLYLQHSSSSHRQHQQHQQRHHSLQLHPPSPSLNVNANAAAAAAAAAVGHHGGAHPSAVAAAAVAAAAAQATSSRHSLPQPVSPSGGGGGGANLSAVAAAQHVQSATGPLPALQPPPSHLHPPILHQHAHHGLSHSHSLQQAQAHAQGQSMHTHSSPSLATVIHPPISLSPHHQPHAFQQHPHQQQQQLGNLHHHQQQQHLSHNKHPGFMMTHSLEGEFAPSSPRMGGHSSEQPRDSPQGHSSSIPPHARGSQMHNHHHHHHHIAPQTSHGSSTSLVGQDGMPPPAPRPRGPKLKFTPQDDALLVDLKETRNLTWKQIADFFPGRSSGTLQVRYCTKLKAKTTLWTSDSIQKLETALREYENDRWRIVASKVGNGFTPAACKEKAFELAEAKGGAGLGSECDMGDLSGVGIHGGASGGESMQRGGSLRSGGGLCGVGDEHDGGGDGGVEDEEGMEIDDENEVGAQHGNFLHHGGSGAGQSQRHHGQLHEHDHVQQQHVRHHHHHHHHHHQSTGLSQDERLRVSPMLGGHPLGGGGGGGSGQQSKVKYSSSRSSSPLQAGRRVSSSTLADVNTFSTLLEEQAQAQAYSQHQSSKQQQHSGHGGGSAPHGGMSHSYGHIQHTRRGSEKRSRDERINEADGDGEVMTGGVEVVDSAS